MSSTSSAAKQLSDGNSQGTVLGQSTTDKIAFYGVTAVAQQSGTGAVSVTTTATTTSTPWGFSTSTQATAIITGLNAVMTILKNLGLYSGT